MASPGFRWAAVLLALAATTAAGCATHVQLPEDYYASPRKEKVGILLSQTPPAALVKAGQQGLLDLAISSAATSDFQKHLGSLKTHVAARHVASSVFAAGLGKRFPEVRVLDETIEQMGLEETEGGDDKTISELNVTRLATTQKVDTILLLRVTFIGCTRSYYGFVPTGSPNGGMTVQGILVEGKTNKVLWNHTVTGAAETVGDWDQPPDYPAVDHSIAEAVGTTIGQLFEDLARVPPPGTDPARITAILGGGS